MWTISKVFIEFVTVLLLFYVLVFWLRGMWNLSSLTRDRTHTPCIGRQSLFFSLLICLSFSFLFIYFWLCWVFIAAHCGEWGLLFVAVNGLLNAVASLVMEHGALGTRAQ